MSNRINPDDFMNDPMFKELRTFGSNTSDLNNEMPTEVLMAYRNASAVKARKVWLRRSIFSILAIGILAPSLSYAQLLPTPVDNVVKRVTHLVTAPIRIVTETVSRVTNSNPPEQNLNVAPDTGTATATPSTTQTPTQSSTPVSSPVPVAPQVQAVPSPTRKPEQHEQEKSQTPKPAKPVKPAEQKSEKSDDGESKSSPTPSVSPSGKKDSGEGEGEKSGASAKPLPAASAGASKPTVVSGVESKGEAKKVESKKED